MNERQTLSILFYLRRDKKKIDTDIPIYMRITVNGKRAEMAVHRFINPEYWNNESGVPRSSRNEIKQLNEYLSLQRRKAYQAQKSLIEDGKSLTAIGIRNLVQGTSDKQHTVLETFSCWSDLGYLSE